MLSRDDICVQQNDRQKYTNYEKDKHTDNKNNNNN